MYWLPVGACGHGGSDEGAGQIDARPAGQIDARPACAGQIDARPAGEIQQWPSSQLAAPDAPLDAPPFSAASAEAEARDEAEVARAAVDAAEAVARPEAEARAAEADRRRS